jgi:bacteriocin-like protein
MSDENKPIEKDALKEKPEELTIDELKAVTGGAEGDLSNFSSHTVNDKVSP